MVNKAIIIGNLGKDPELKEGERTAVCSFSVACAERYKQGDEWKEKTEWINIVVFGAQAKACAQYLGKGSQVYIEGKIQTSSYEKDGRKIYQTKVVANEVKFLTKRDQPKVSFTEEQLGDDFESDDVPF
jgi:single-strand DNA-binding protein